MTRPAETEPKKVPAFKNEQEAGDFWDTHSPLDYPEDFREVQVTFDRPLIKRGITIKLSQETIDELRELAEAKGLGSSTLVRMWILERLREDQAHQAKSS